MATPLFNYRWINTNLISFLYNDFALHFIPHLYTVILHRLHLLYYKSISTVFMTFVAMRQEMKTFTIKIDLPCLFYLPMESPVTVLFIFLCGFALMPGVLLFQSEGVPLVFLVGQV
jgi:hypothetical protein